MISDAAKVETKQQQTERAKGFSGFAYSLDAFLPVVNLAQAENWSPDPSRSYTANVSKFNVEVSGAMIRFYLWIHILSGWTLCTLLVVALARVFNK